MKQNLFQKYSFPLESVYLILLLNDRLVRQIDLLCNFYLEVD